MALMQVHPETAVLGPKGRAQMVFSNNTKY